MLRSAQLISQHGVKAVEGAARTLREDTLDRANTLADYYKSYSGARWDEQEEEERHAREAEGGASPRHERQEPLQEEEEGGGGGEVPTEGSEEEEQEEQEDEEVLLIRGATKAAAETLRARFEKSEAERAASSAARAVRRERLAAERAGPKCSAFLIPSSISV